MEERGRVRKSGFWILKVHNKQTERRIEMKFVGNNDMLGQTMPQVPK